MDQKAFPGIRAGKRFAKVTGRVKLLSPEPRRRSGLAFRQWRSNALIEVGRKDGGARSIAVVLKASRQQ